MSKFHYIVRATTSDNVSSLDAKDETSALKELERIYGIPNDHISFEIIDKDRHDQEVDRIARVRLAEAERVE